MTDAIVDLRGAVPASLPQAARRARGLVLAGSDLETLPAALAELTQLRMLDLAHNRLAAMPEAIRPLAALTYLGCDANELETLPDWIGELERLIEPRLRETGPARQRAHGAPGLARGAW